MSAIVLKKWCKITKNLPFGEEIAQQFGIFYEKKAKLCERGGKNAIFFVTLHCRK